MYLRSIAIWIYSTKKLSGNIITIESKHGKLFLAAQGELHVRDCNVYHTCLNLVLWEIEAKMACQTKEGLQI